MEDLVFEKGSYRTSTGKVPLPVRMFPSLSFYIRDLVIIFKASAKAKRLQYDTAAWAESSLEVLRALESVGVSIEISGIENFRGLEEPCVFISNHMSTLETFVLPCIIAPFREVTFVVKQSLIDYPVFKYVMRSRDPIVVGRANPRDDLRAVIEGGAERLKLGRSIIIFPQTTRTADFDPEKFNTLGVKLAKKAEAPIVPVALKTDAWSNGRLLKDFGRIDPAKKVHFAFGQPLRVKGRGNEEHEEIIRFIKNKLGEWGRS